MKGFERFVLGMRKSLNVQITRSSEGSIVRSHWTRCITTSSCVSIICCGIRRIFLLTLVLVTKTVNHDRCVIPMVFYHCPHRIHICPVRVLCSIISVFVPTHDSHCLMKKKKSVCDFHFGMDLKKVRTSNMSYTLDRYGL